MHFSSLPVKTAFALAVAILQTFFPGYVAHSAQLSGDIILNLENADCVAEFYGDTYGEGRATWFIMMFPTEGHSDGFQTEIVSRNRSFSQGIVTGRARFTCAPNNNLWTGNYKKGQITSMLTGTWYLTDFDDEMLPHTYYPSAGGDMYITNNEDGTYTFEFDFEDCYGSSYTWKGAWTGTPLLEDMVNPADINDVAYGGSTSIKVDGRSIKLSGRPGKVSVTDISGRTVYSGYDCDIDLPGPGYYIVKSGKEVMKIFTE